MDRNSNYLKKISPQLYFKELCHTLRMCAMKRYILKFQVLRVIQYQEFIVMYRSHCTATEMIPTIEMISATVMNPNHHRNDPHHRNDTGGHHRNDPRNIGNGIKRTTKTGQQFSACFLFIYIASFLRCVIYLLPHFILQ